MPSIPKFSSEATAQQLGLLNAPDDIKRGLDTNRDGQISSLELQKAVQATGLDYDQILDATEEARLRSYLPPPPAPSTSSTTPTTPSTPATPSSSPSTPASLPARAGAGLQLSRATLSRAPSEGRARLEAWQSLINDNQHKSDADKLRLVNNFFNSNIRYTRDSQNHGVSDHWSTPIEVLSSGKGDCEDYAMAKYITLRRMGFPPSELRMVIGKLKEPGNPAHMILVHHPRNGEAPHILDNFSNRRPSVADYASIFNPIFSFNEIELRTVFVGDDATKWRGHFPLSMNRLSKFEDAQDRMRAERQWPLPR